MLAAHAVAMVFIALSVLTLVADVINPLKLPLTCASHGPAAVLGAASYGPMTGVCSPPWCEHAPRRPPDMLTMPSLHSSM